MGLTGTLLQISKQKCGHCKKEYGKHSKKGFMKCLYTANYNLYTAYNKLNEFEEEKKKNEQEKTFDKIIVDEKGNVEIDGEIGELKKSLIKENDNNKHE